MCATTLLASPTAGKPPFALHVLPDYFARGLVIMMSMLTCDGEHPAVRMLTCDGEHA